MTRDEYADILLPGIDKTVADYEKMYPKRELEEGAIVSRFAPSPTGFVHIGSLFASLVERKAAKDTNGVFFLRIEDTDQKREVENGIKSILDSLKQFDVTFDEGMINQTESRGDYGPYVQSKRKEIYQAFAKHLIINDFAYPCFLTEQELEDIRNEQERSKNRLGCYGRFAKCHDISMTESLQKIDNNEEYIIRLKSPGSFDKKIVVEDLIKGKIEFPENDLDIVIIKNDGLPTYHFAHLVDDYLMRTTHVIRGDEWVPSLPIHIQLFQVFGFKIPKYAHLSPLMKEEDGGRRKLSKRKDPEAAISYYHEKGIPVEAVKLYIMTVANSNFEMWMEQNPDKGIDDFEFSFKKVSTGGSLFDLDKLVNISKNYISKLKATDVYDMAITYSKEYDEELYNLLSKYKDYSIGIFNIEREQKKPRKDISMFSEVKQEIWYMYDELFNCVSYEWDKINDVNEIKTILNSYLEVYEFNDDKETWFNKMKEVCDCLGYASNMKEYKENPDNFKGNIADLSMVLRVALTSKQMTPDLYEIMKLLGKDRIKERFERIS